MMVQKYLFRLKETILLVVDFFFTIAEDSYNMNLYEITHNLTKGNFCSDECSICKLFNNKLLIRLIDLQYIKNLNDHKKDELGYGDLDVCGWCVMKDQNTNKNKSIHKYLYDLPKIPKEEYIKLCTDVQRQTLFAGIFAGERFFM